MSVTRNRWRPPRWTQRATATPQRQRELNEIKKDNQTALTPWIPGDFIVAYGTLIAAWSSLSRSFFALAAIALISSVAFVWLGAFATTGLKNPTRTVRRRLFAPTAVGGPLSIFVALTIPASGLNDFMPGS